MQIAAHSYGKIDGKFRFVLPCCEVDVGASDDEERVFCPKCGEKYKLGKLPLRNKE